MNTDDRRHCRELLEEAMSYAQTKANLGQQLQVSPQAVSAWLNCKSSMTRANYLRLEDWLRAARRRFPQLRRKILEKGTRS